MVLALLHLLVFGVPTASADDKLAFVINGTTPSELQIETDALRTGLAQRGWSETDFDRPKSSELIEALKARAGALPSGSHSRVTLVFNCHGNTTEKPGEEHFCCLNEGCSEEITSHSISEVAKAFQRKGAQVAVIDTTCGGGTTVLTLEKEAPGVCGIAYSTANSVFTAKHFLPGPDEISTYLVAPPGEAFRQEQTVKTFADIVAWSQRRMLRTYNRHTIDQHVFQTGCSRYSHSLRSFLGHEGGLISEDALKRADAQGAIYGEPSAPGSYSPLLGQTCPWEYSQPAKAEALALVQSLGDEIDFTRILAEYRNWAVQFPYDRIHSVTDLTRTIRELLAQISEKREKLRQAILELAALTREQGDPRRIKDKAASIRSLRDETTELITTLNPVLNVAEEIRCRQDPHPSAKACRKMEL